MPIDTTYRPINRDQIIVNCLEAFMSQVFDGISLRDVAVELDGNAIIQGTLGICTRIVHVAAGAVGLRKDNAPQSATDCNLL